MLREWQGSAHARSASSPAFTAMRAAAPDRAGCDVCHRPLARYAAPASVVDDGVTCDACHTLRAVEAAAARSPRFELAVAEPVRYGPFCELDDHYFHRMGCSPLHRKSELCASCHQLEIEPAGGGAAIPIYTTYREWQETRYARDGVECQDCHMPPGRAPIAEGAAVRRVGDHGLAPRGRPPIALSATARIDPEGGEAIAVVVELANRGAGHFLPTGSPDRRLVLRAIALDDAGHEVARDETSFGRPLVDAGGKPVPRAGAIAAGQDVRLPPGVTVSRELTLRAPPPAGRVRVELIRRPMDPAIAAALGVAPPDDRVLLSAELPYRAAHRARDLARRARGRP